MQIKCTIVQADAFVAARSLSTYNRKQAKKRIFAEIRRQHPEARARKFVLFVQDPSNPLYCVLRDKSTKLPLDDGRPEPVQLAAPVVAKVAKPKVAKVAPGIKAVAKKAVAKKAVAKKAVAKKAVAKKAEPVIVAKLVTKAPAKKVAAKAPTKAVAKKAAPAKKVAAKAVAKRK